MRTGTRTGKGEKKHAFAKDNVGLTASFPPRSALYAHGLNSRWFSNPENPEEFGFASSCFPLPFPFPFPYPFNSSLPPLLAGSLQAAC
jgi:hypothetical protein